MRDTANAIFSLIGLVVAIPLIAILIAVFVTMLQSGPMGIAAAGLLVFMCVGSVRRMWAEVQAEAAEKARRMSGN